jgi:hypothetical protein
MTFIVQPLCIGMYVYNIMTILCTVVVSYEKIVETSSFEVQNLIVEFRQCRYVDRVVSQSFSVFPYSIAFQFDADNNLWWVDKLENM